VGFDRRHHDWTALFRSTDAHTRADRIDVEPPAILMDEGPPVGVFPCFCAQNLE